MKKIPQDIIGDIAVLKFPREISKRIKKSKAKQFLIEHPHVKTVLEKTEKISGRLRKPKTEYLSGINTKIATYKENNCIFKLNIDETYFSPRLSEQRKKISELILKKIKQEKRKTNILVMFSGIAPFPVVIAKKLKQEGKNALIVSNEINKSASKYAEENVLLNKLPEIKIIQCDAKKLPEKLKKHNLPLKYDFIVMPRPNLKETFLQTALKLSKKSSVIYYHGFGTKEKVLKEIKDNLNKKHRLKIEKAGDIGKNKFRWLAVIEF